jgi:ATP-dependent protease ClpP protease subunit
MFHFIRSQNTLIFVTKNGIKMSSLKIIYTLNNSLDIWATGNANRPLEIEARAGDNVAQISIIGQISNWSNANSGTVRRDIIALGKKFKTCEVYVNSEGGSCIEANEIVNILQENFDSIKVIGGAIVASAASFIFCSFPNSLSKNSQVMIHEPRGYYSGTHKNIMKQLKLLKDLEDQYIAIYAGKTGLSNEAVSDLWNDGDHWMNAKEAKESGFADAIDGEGAITEEDAKAIAAMGSPYKVSATAKKRASDAPTTTNTNKYPNDMDSKILAVSLDLPADATEAQITAKINELKAAKVTAEANAETQKTANIKAMLDKAETDKKITPAVRANYEQMAANDFDNVKAILDAVTPVVPISAQIGADGKTVPGAAPTSDFPYKSYEECAEAGDQEAWAALEIAEPEKANAMFEAQFKKD